MKQAGPNGPQSPANALRGLRFSTVRLVVKCASTLKYGTGFFYVLDAKELQMPMIVTNRHVLDGIKSIEFVLPTAFRDTGKREMGKVSLPAEQLRIVHHKVGSIDLSAIMLGPIIHQLHLSNRATANTWYDSSDLPDKRDRDSIEAGETILLIGYPNGLWDERQGTPLLRRGIAATPPLQPHNGRPEFVIDCGCFPGSSGSPVVHLREYPMLRDGELCIEQSISLLGVLYGGPVHGELGIVEIHPIATDELAVPRSGMPMHLGYAITGHEVEALAQQAADEVGRPGA